jgi:DNA-binding MarR family transcriptional regulator
MARSNRPSPEALVDPVEVAGHLRMSVARLARLLRQQDESGLSPTLTAALVTISREGPLTLGRLAARERVAPPSITKVVGKLEDRGLVERRVDESDRRVTRVEISSAGRKQLEASRTRRTAWLATRLLDLSDDDVGRLVEVLPVLDALADADTDTDIDIDTDTDTDTVDPADAPGSRSSR